MNMKLEASHATTMIYTHSEMCDNCDCYLVRTCSKEHASPATCDLS